MDTPQFGAPIKDNQFVSPAANTSPSRQGFSLNLNFFEVGLLVFQVRHSPKVRPIRRRGDHARSQKSRSRPRTASNASSSKRYMRLMDADIGTHVTLTVRSRELVAKPAASMRKRYSLTGAP